MWQRRFRFNPTRLLPQRALPALLALLLVACSGSRDPTGEFYTFWDDAGACQSGERSPWGLSVAGEALGPCDFPDRFVWVTYGALWCETSRKQAPAFRDAAGRNADLAEFIQVLTGGPEVFTAASADDAARWASRNRLDPRRVVSEGHSERTVPQHLLIGPDGRTWLRWIGLLSADEIEEILLDFHRGRRRPQR